MHHNTIKKYFSLCLMVILLSACATKKNATTGNKNELPPIKTSILIDHLDSLANQRPSFFYTKLNSHFQNKEHNVHFKTSIRMKTDSALQALITFARIPIYNAIVTSDTLTLLDRRNNCYLQENMSFFKNRFDVRFKQKNIEELVLGMPIAWNKKRDYQQIKDAHSYIISTDKNNTSEEVLPYTIRYFLDDSTQSLHKEIIESLEDSSVIVINYYGRKKRDGYSIPTSGDMRITTPNGETFLEFRYKAISINKPRILYLRIPKDYRRCE